MSRARKALMAAAAAFGTGMTTALVNGDQPATTEGWIGLIAGCLAAAIVAAAATYSVRNEGPDIGPNGSTTTRAVPPAGTF